MPLRSRDPREIAPVDSYFRNAAKTRMVQIVAVDWSKAQGEDLMTGELVEISRIDLIQRWVRVRPAAGEVQA